MLRKLYAGANMRAGAGGTMGGWLLCAITPSPPGIPWPCSADAHKDANAKTASCRRLTPSCTGHTGDATAGGGGPRGRLRQRQDSRVVSTASAPRITRTKLGPGVIVAYYAAPSHRAAPGDALSTMMHLLAPDTVSVPDARTAGRGGAGALGAAHRGAAGDERTLI